MNRRIIVFVVFVSLLICKQGYCLFRDDIGNQQVQSAIKIKRAKDEQRKKQYEQIKQQEAIKKDNTADNMTYSSQTSKQKSTKENFTQAINSEKTKPLLQYKRYTSKGAIIDTAHPAVVLTNTTVKKQEKRRSNKGFIFLLLVLGIGGFIIFRQQPKKG